MSSGIEPTAATLSDSQQPSAINENELASGSERYLLDDPVTAEDMPRRSPESLSHPTTHQDDSERAVAFDGVADSQPEYFQLPTDAESRFDEGLPLIQREEDSEEAGWQQEVPTEQSSHPDRETVNSEQAFGNFFDSDFPGSAEGEDLQFALKPPERKSTAQVLSSLQVASSEEEEGDLQPGAANSELQSTANPSGTLNDPKEEARGDGNSDPMDDQSLAEMWKAALEDDELLEDPEDEVLLPNKEVSPDDGPWDPALVENAQTLDEPTSSSFPQSGTDYPSLNEHQATDPSASSSSLGQPSQSMMPAGIMAGSQPLHNAQYHVPSPQASYGLSGSANNRLPSSVQANNPEQHPQAWSTWQSHQQPRPDLPKAQSFADKSKGGYSSPYDLPTDIIMPRRRPGAHHAAGRAVGYGPGQANIPPPRHSSMSTPQSVPGIPQPQQHPYGARSISSMSTSQLLSATTYQPAMNGNLSGAALSKPQTSTNSFFEELPPVERRRRSSNLARVTTQRGVSASPISAPLVAHPSTQSYIPVPGGASDLVPRQSSAPPMAVSAEQLRAPERSSPYESIPPRSSAEPQMSTYVSRYSPAPLAQPTGYGRSKYAPVPAAVPLSGPMPHQPRTSSPLAFQPRPSHRSHSPTASTVSGNTRTVAQRQPGAASRAQELTASGSSDQNDVTKEGEHHSGTAEDETRDSGNLNQTPIGASQPHYVAEASGTPRPSTESVSSVKPNITSSAIHSSPPKRLVNNYMQQGQPHIPFMDNTIQPPRRSQTQSPGTAQLGPLNSAALREPYPRPASVDVPTSPKLYAGTTSFPLTTRARGFSQALSYIVPNDGRENDPLCRWRGCPIIRWGFGGTVVTSFPKEVQRYSSGQQYPSVKCSPGEVRTRSFNTILPIEDHIARFPGPLRGKGKKKDLISWLSFRIDELARVEEQQAYSGHVENPRRREGQLLLRILRIFIENDGLLAGNDTVQKAVSEVLSVGILDHTHAQTSLVLGNPVGRASRDEKSDDANIEAIDGIRKTLLSGNREAAIWQAADKRLWAHAMLISSTVSPELWKQVVQEFVRQEIRDVGESAKPLSALYEVFGGNWEESIDELVPPSARGGFQLVSKNTDSASNKSGLEGLEKWRETLLLVLNNRTPDDGQALAALGRLLLGYGRAEAAHICYLFAKPYSSFSGPDDPQTSIALVGANHLQAPLNFANDLDSIILSEVYEFGLSLATSSPSSSVPHLQAYKLYHAFVLAEHGYRSQAQQYCDAIFSLIRSSTKPSGYHHGLLLSFLDDFSRRLQQSPKDGASSWMSKPSMEKVSGSLFAKFNSFIAGDDNDHALAKTDIDGNRSDLGPFARVAADTASISRPSSQNDSHATFRPMNIYAGGAPQGSLGASNRYSPYTPAFSDIPRATQPYTPAYSDAPRPREPNSQYPGTLGLPLNLQRASTDPVPASSTGYVPSGQLGQPGTGSIHSSIYSTVSPAKSDAPYPTWGSQAELDASMSSSSLGFSNGTVSQEGFTYGEPRYQMGGNSELPKGFAGEGLAHSLRLSESSEIEAAQERTFSGYQPPSYEPPTSYSSSYMPLSESDDPPSKESFSDIRRADKISPIKEDDDDNDIVARTAELARKEKMQKDKEAEENFKRAAEADGESTFVGVNTCNHLPNGVAAKLDQQQKEKKGWFGGWFGKKEQSAGPGPIKAKLGEENSFYYDTELKKWVNKKVQPSRLVLKASQMLTCAIKGGTAPTTSSSTPPPPKGPSSRAPSSTNSSTPADSANPAPPPSNLSIPRLSPNRPPLTKAATTPGPISGSNTPGRSNSPTPSGPSEAPNNETTTTTTTGNTSTPMRPAPPTRPATSMSNASSIDDLLGPAGAARKGGTIKKAKKGRGYVDVMAAKS